VTVFSKMGRWRALREQSKVLSHIKKKEKDLTQRTQRTQRWSTEGTEKKEKI